MIFFKVDSLNLCLSLLDKKCIVKPMTVDENIDILSLQETNIEINIDHELMSFLGYKFESKRNNIKARVGIYI
jgi:exonuclease III